MGKLEEMLASGRAPMALIRGSGRRVAAPIEAPLFSTPAALERRAAGIAKVIKRYREDAQTAKANRRCSRKPEEVFERVGSVPVEEYLQMQEQMGDAIHDENELRDELRARGKSIE